MKVKQILQNDDLRVVTNLDYVKGLERSLLKEARYSVEFVFECAGPAIAAVGYVIVQKAKKKVFTAIVPVARPKEPLAARADRLLISEFRLKCLKKALKKIRKQNSKTDEAIDKAVASSKRTTLLST